MSLTLTLERGGGEVSGSGTNIELDGTIAGGAIESVEMYGDTQQQTYSGKNLANPEPLGYADMGITATYNAQTGDITLSGTAIGGYSIPFRRVDQTIPAGTYTIKQYGELSHGRMGINFRRADGTQIVEYVVNTGTLVNTFTLSEPAAKTYLYTLYHAAGQTVEGTVKFQMEAGSTATSFEPYVGGTASPNPDYPQEVQTVTGRQVVTISDGGSESQEYEINLGDIELCKIGTYQDYIYKSGEDWYVHKEIKKLDVSSLGGWYLNNNTNFRTLAGVSDIVFPADNNTVGAIISANYTAQAANSIANGDYDYAIGLGSASYLTIRNKDISTVAAFETYLSNNQIYAYVALATPTDTQITNSALIAQLNALNAGDTYDGTTLITVSSENLAGSLDVTVSSNITKTYTEVEIGSPFTIADVEGKSSNTTLDGNVYVDWAYNKKQYSFDLFNLTPQDYADIRAFYDYQFNNSAFPTITVPELNIDKLPVYMEISSRNIINQCLLTDKLTIKFRETVQP